MKRSAVAMLVGLLAVVSVIPVLYTGCGVSNPVEPNWGYPTLSPTFTPGGPTNTPTLSPTPTFTLSPTITTTVFPTSTYTMTATPTVPGFVFNSSANVAAFAINTGAGNAAVNSASSVVFNSTFNNCTTITGAMEVTLGFTAVNQAVFIQQTLTTPLNLSGKTITMILESTTGWNSDAEQLYGAIFVQENVSPYACIYQTGTGLYTGASTASSSGCVTLSLTMPSSSTAAGGYTGYSVFNGTFDPTQSQIVGMQLGTGASGNTFTPTVEDIQSWLYQ